MGVASRPPERRWLDPRPTPILLLSTAAAVVVVGLGAETIHRSAVAPADATLDLMAGWSIALAGLIAWIRRPESRVGPLLVLSGLTWFLGDVATSAITTVGLAGGVLLMVHRAPIFHAVLTYPTGRSSRRGEPIAVGLAYLYAVIVPSVPGELLTVSVVVGLVVVTVRSWRTAVGPLRPARGRGAVAAVIVASALLVGSLGRVGGVGAGAEDILLWTYEVALMAAALLMCVDLLRRRWSESALTQLVVDLGDDHDADAVRSRLADALGDPSLRLVFVIPDTGALVDERGHPTALPDADRHLAVTSITDRGEPIAVLIHDPSVLDDPALIDDIASAARLSLSNVRLRAEVQRRVEDVAASRRRILVTGEAERRRLRAELEARVGRELEEVGTLLASARQDVRDDPGARVWLDEVEQELRLSREEVDDLAAGLSPPLLMEQGLEGALASLGRRCRPPARVRVTSRGLSASIETTCYFVVAEALTNVTKHAHASRVDVVVSSENGVVLVEVSDDGIGGAEGLGEAGPRGIADRVEALGGSSSVASAVGAGTSIRAAIPVDRNSEPDPSHPGTRRNGFTTKPVGSQRPSDTESEQSGS